MYFVKRLLAILILFYAYSAIAMLCENVFESASALRNNRVNDSTPGKKDTLNSVVNRNALPDAETKLEVRLEKDTETIEYFRDLVSREWDLIWNSLFPKDDVIVIEGVPQLTREQQIDVMYEIIERPEYSVFDARERIKWLRVLFDNGVDVNTQNVSGDSPLHVAVRMRGIAGKKLVNFLLKNGADIHLENHFSRTPLDIAYAHNNQKVAEILQNEM